MEQLPAHIKFNSFCKEQKQKIKFELKEHILNYIQIAIKSFFASELENFQNLNLKLNDVNQILI